MTKKKGAAKKKPAPKAHVQHAVRVKALVREKPVGRVTHFFGGIKVAIVKCKTPFARGARLRFRGATTDFAETVSSIQYNHAPVLRAKKGQQIGVKVKKRVREGDFVFLEK